jgi:TRAP-type C4-dicarboxylate transport system permease small subunit
MFRIFAQQLINGNKLPQAPSSPDALQHILTILFTLIGALALLMMVIAGLRYVLSQGEPQKMTEIRRQIIYIAIGLVLAASADAIVTFVLGRSG